MTNEWLKKFPEKEILITSLDLFSMFRQELLPSFILDEGMSRKYAGLYYIDEHKVTLLPFAVEYSTSERFINLLLHEIGHSTSMYTNRWNRLTDNSPRRSIKEVNNLEEQIAETIAMVFTLTLLNTTSNCNERDFNKYLIKNSSKYRLPWEEVVLAVETFVNPDKINLARKWMSILKRHISNNNITFLKEGIFNGE